MKNSLQNIEWCGGQAPGTMRVSWTRTIVGWFNVRNIETGDVININTLAFGSIFDVNRKVTTAME